ncbi:MAG TPA: flagellar biosynthesis protein FlgD [Planctomycetes bacterium]|nr:flagellar biosynthesis protein FlgD [Planctomycetota bacterium]
MEIPGTSANDSAPTVLGATGGASGFQSVDQGQFLDLFVAQLRNQDPINPVKNEDFVAQLATFSQLDQLKQMNDNIVAQIALGQSNALLAQLTGSSDLIGKQVTWTDPSTGFETTGQVERVKILDGLAVLRISGQDVPLANVTEVLGAESADESTAA